jgi:hypothetical protein
MKIRGYTDETKFINSFNSETVSAKKCFISSFSIVFGGNSQTGSSIFGNTTAATSGGIFGQKPAASPFGGQMAATGTQQL